MLLPLSIERPAFLRASQLHSFSSQPALLLEFFAPRLEHLIVRGFFDATGHEMFSHGFLSFVHIRPWDAMTSRFCGHVPIVAQLRVLFGFLWRRRMLRPQKFLARLRPIGLGKFVRLALLH